MDAILGISRLRALLARLLVNLKAKQSPRSDSPNALQFLATGKSGIIYEIDHNRVLKEFHERSDGEIERQVYEHLGSHHNIVKLLEIRTDGSLVLERGKSLRMICSTTTHEIPLKKKVHWLRHAARGYQYLHTRNIIHGDVGCNNLVLAKDGRVKLIDFEGCSFNGGPAGSCYEWFSYRPSEPGVTRGTDIFAFGCVMYEVLTGEPPYNEFKTMDDPYTHVEELYNNNQFPDVTNLPLGYVIDGCWHDRFSSMDEVLQELKAFCYKSSNSKSRS